MQTKIDTLIAMATSYGAAASVNQDTGLVQVIMPPTRTQQKKNQDGDMFVRGSLPVEEQTIDDAIAFINEWKEFWTLKDSITQKAIKEFLRDKLYTNDKWALNGLLAIFALQTPQEQSSDHTIVRNNVGFSGVDAEVMSSIAKQLIGRIKDRIKQNRDPDPTKCLSQKQKDLVRKIMKKYWKQIQECSDEHKLLKMVKASIDAANASGAQQTLSLGVN